MGGEVVNCTTVRVKEGRLDDFRAAVEAIVAVVEERDPGTRGYDVYVDAAGAGRFLERYESGEAMLAHLANVGPLFPQVMDTCEVERIEVYGDLGAEVEKALAGFEPTPGLFTSVLSSGR